MTAPPTLASQDYLEALYEMDEEGIPTVRTRLAAWLGVSPPSVTQAVARLVRDGLVEPRGRELAFTDRGRRTAEVLVRRHRLAERFLIHIMGLPWHQAHEEAQRWERAISDRVEERITAMLDDPATCPHGNPIPGSSHRVDQSGLVPLDTVEPGRQVVLRRLTEDLELDIGVMRFLEESGLMPGASVEVRGVAPDGTITLHVEGSSVALGGHLADNLWVEATAAASV